MNQDNKEVDMNERIRTLYIQAINDTKNDPVDDINLQIAEKFAELIINDCADVVNNQGRFLRFSDLSANIKKYFGY